MNLPNKLTVFRIILVPLLIFFLLNTYIANNYLIAMIIFIVAAITDHIDGKIARKHNQVTDFGKFLDPLADKILVISVFLCFIELGFISSIPVIIIIMREFTVTSVRLMAALKGKVLAANIWGKIKTVSQIVAILTIIILNYMSKPWSFFSGLENISAISNNIIWITVVFSVISGASYIYDNVNLIKNEK